MMQFYLEDFNSNPNPNPQGCVLETKSKKFTDWFWEFDIQVLNSPKTRILQKL